MSNGRKRDNAEGRYQRCPVCEGHGIVPQGFYLHLAGQTFGSTSTAPERCRQCDGLGMILTPTYPVRVPE